MASDQRQWQNYQAALHEALRLLEAGEPSPTRALQEAARTVGDCGEWIKRFLFTAGTDVVICPCCHNTARYGVETLAQTGRRAQALELIRSKIL